MPGSATDVHPGHDLAGLARRIFILRQRRRRASARSMDIVDRNWGCSGVCEPISSHNLAVARFRFEALLHGIPFQLSKSRYRQE